MPLLGLNGVIINGVITPRNILSKWVTGGITPISGVLTLLRTGRGSLCTNIYTCSIIFTISHSNQVDSFHSSLISFQRLQITKRLPRKPLGLVHLPTLPDSFFPHRSPAPRVFRGYVHDLMTKEGPGS